MMGNWRKRIGRFGSVQRVASTAAIAILAVSPAIVPMTGSHLDGVGLAITEAVFGEPVYAQAPGEPSPTAKCLAEAEAEYRACLKRSPWYKDPLCWAARAVDYAACGLRFVTG